MIRVRLAFPAVVLLFSLSIPSAGQSFTETPSAPVVPRAQQAQPQSPAEASGIVVKPGLTDEQLGDLCIVRKEWREVVVAEERLACRTPADPAYPNKLGVAVHQPAAL